MTQTDSNLDIFLFAPWKYQEDDLQEDLPAVQVPWYNIFMHLKCIFNLIACERMADLSAQMRAMNFKSKGMCMQWNCAGEYFTSASTEH